MHLRRTKVITTVGPTTSCHLFGSVLPGSGRRESDIKSAAKEMIKPF